jgi:putative N6-adenine-specific DNA methylase
MPYYFATVARGLEALAAQELLTLGAESIDPQFCGVTFQGDRALLYRINLWARLPFRILVQIGQGSAHDGDDLYQSLQQIPWQTYLTPAQTLAVKVTGKNQRLNHSHFTAVQAKRAIVDYQQQYWGDRSNVDPQDADVNVNLHLHEDQVQVSLDSSGSSLHRRGYRPAMGAAPLKESLAAALIQYSGWTSELAFYDPLCGSGTLPIEASLMGLKIAPGLFRDQFGFERWPDFDAVLWQSLVEQARSQQLHHLPHPILGSDQNPEIISQAQANALASGTAAYLDFSCQELATVEAPADQGVLLCNPPYGERLGDRATLADFYRLLGDVLKQRFRGWTAFVLSGNKQLSQAIRLKSAQRIPIYNGQLLCQLMKYELY